MLDSQENAAYDGAGQATLAWLVCFQREVRSEERSAAMDRISCLGRRIGAVVLVLCLFPACVIRIGTGGPGDEEEIGLGSGGSGGTMSGGNATSSSSSGEPTTEEVVAQLAPEELARSSTRAGFAAAYAMGQVEALGLDPAAVDDAMLLNLMDQYLPIGSAEADAWMATLDPTVLAAGIPVKYECSLPEMGCEAVTHCKHGYIPPVVHRCHVVDCGDAGCSLCPSWVADGLKHIMFKRWCAYTCVQHASGPPKIVASGVGFISSFGSYFGGPICFP